MDRVSRALQSMLLAAIIMTPVLAAAQAPPKAATPIAPKVEQLDSKACGNSDTRTTIGQGGEVQVQRPNDKTLSDKLASSNGVICPPDQVDPEIKAPTPQGGPMPVIPPPGSPGGDPSVTPK